MSREDAVERARRGSVHHVMRLVNARHHVVHAPPRSISPYSTIDYSTNMGSIEAALEACNRQKPPVYAAIAREYGVDRSTLSRRYRSITAAKPRIREDQLLLIV